MKHGGNAIADAAAEGRVGSVLAGAAMAAGELGASTTFKRFLIEEVIFDPAELDDARIDELMSKFGLSQAAYIKQMPANTVIGKLLNQTGAGHERYHYLFPMFPPHLMLPVKAGEHVWAFFEQDKAIDYGFWLCRVNEPRHVDDLNHTHADRKYHATERELTTRDKFDGAPDQTPGFVNGPTSVLNGETVQISASASSTNPDPAAYEDIIKGSDSGKVHEMEAVPRYRKRPGDAVLQGSNNTLIVLGTDRTGRTADFAGSATGKHVSAKSAADQHGGAGSVDIVVGRGQSQKTSGKPLTTTLGNKEVSKRLKDEDPREGDPDFASDSARLYLSMKTDVDGDFQIDFSDAAEQGQPGAVLKTDHVRIVARQTVKFLLQPSPGAPESECAGILIKGGDIIFLPAATGYVKLGSESASKAVLTNPSGIAAGGTVTAPPITSTLGSQVGIGAANGQYASKILVE